MASPQSREPVADPRKFRFDVETKVDDLRQFQALNERSRKCAYDLKELLTHTGGSEEQIMEWRALLMGYQALETVLRRSREGGALRPS